MAHLMHMGTKKWRITIELGRDPRTGKRQRKTKTVHGTKKEAELEKLKMINIYKNKQVVKNINTKKYLLKWLQEYAKNNVTQSTFNDYSFIIKKHLIPTFGKMKLKDIHPRHIIKYQNEKLENGRLDGNGGLSNRSVQYHHRVLSQALKHAVYPYEYISNNPCDGVNAPSPKAPEINPLDYEQANNLLETLEKDKSFYTVVYVNLYTGLRRGEILALKWKDIDLEKLKLQVRRSTEVVRGSKVKYNDPKNNSSIRSVDFDEATALVLNEYKKYTTDYVSNNKLVFIHENGNPILPDYVTSKFRQYADAAGFTDTRFHDLRHTHATWLLKEGVHPKIVQERLGHAKISTTLDLYSHVIPSMQKDAVKKLKKIKK